MGPLSGVDFIVIGPLKSVHLVKETLIYFYLFLPKDDDLWYNKVIKEGWIGK